MAEIKVKGLWKVRFTEYERGWGQREFGPDKYFDTEAEAKACVLDFNKDNTADIAPDWYAQASYHKV